MDKFWNQEVKRLVLASLVFFLLGILVCNFIMLYCAGQMRGEYNELLAAILGNVTALYPDMPEEEILQVLMGETHVDRGAELLARYGIFREYGSRTFDTVEGWINCMQVGLNGCMIVLATACLGIFFTYLARRQGRISEMLHYMRELDRGNYRLVLEDNRDDELSGFRNELYKLTVFLREQANTASLQRRALADSVADISHQLKTPLTSITVLVDNLFENEDMDAFTRRRFLSEITMQLTGISWLVATLLKLSRLDAGVVDFEEKDVSLKLLTDKVIRNLEMISELRQVELVSMLPEDIIVTGDFLWLTECLSNLVKNAVEHSSCGGRVEISAEENEIYTLLKVKDYGEGISEEEQKNLFRRFYRGRCAGADSVGLGLALAKEIIEKQGGYIAVESEPGEGTSFLVKFMKCH